MAKKSSSVSKAVKPTNKKVSTSKVSLRPTPIKKVSKTKGVKVSSQKKQSAVLQPQSIENLQAQLTQREAELAIINSIQQGLAVKLNFQAIVDMVGDKLREVFNTPDLAITWYDEKANLVNYLYMYEHGQRLVVPSGPPYVGGIYEAEIKTRQPLVFNNVEDYAKVNGGAIPGTDMSKSLVSVPIISNDRFLGDISMENYERENVYGESELRLLTTIASSLGTALENAHLFDETQRLLKITEDRAAELAVINSIQQGLAAELDFQTIIDLVGDKLREVLKTGEIGIRWHEPKTNLIHYLYEYEHGERITIPSAPPQGKTWEKLVRTRQPIVLNTAAAMQELGVTYVPGTDQSKSIMYVPIVGSDRILGSIVTENYEKENAYTEADTRLLTTVASSMGVALENARLFNEVQKNNFEISEALKQQTATSDVLRAMSGFQPDLRSLLEIIAVNIAKVCDTDDAHIYRIENNLLKEWTHRGPIPGLEEGESLPLSRGSVIGRSIVDRQIVHIHDAAVEMDETEYPVSSSLQHRWGYRTVLATPLLRDGEPIGGIAIRRKVVQPFTNKQIELVKTFADQAVIAIENVRLFDETQRLLKDTQQRNAELAIINSVQAALAAELNIQGIYEAVGDKIREIFDKKDVGIRIYDPKTNLIHYPYAYENGERITIDSHLITEKGFAGHILRTRETVVINENMQKASVKYGSYTLPGTEPPKSSVFVPLVAGDQARGLIDIVDLQHEHAFTDSDVRLLQTLANSMSVALENARLFDETQRLLKETEQRNAELAIINGVSQVLTQELDLQSLVDMVGDKLRAAIQAKNIGIGLYNKDTGLLDSVYVYKNDRRLYPNSIPLNTFSLRFARQGKSLVLNEVTDEAWAKFGSNLTFGKAIPKSIIMIPILTGGELIGGITVQDFKISNAFPDSMVRLLETIASNMGTAIQNARLFDETQRLLKETEQRAVELTVINKIQEGLVAELDPQVMYELVGNRIHELFPNQGVILSSYDHSLRQTHYHYVMDAGRRIQPDEPTPFSYISEELIRTRKPLLLNRSVEELEKKNVKTIKGTSQSKSVLFVPLMVGELVQGVIQIADDNLENFFTNADVRLLATVSTSLSVALQNARLFNETQQRNAELAILNGVGEIMAQILDVKSLTRNVGDKVREIFNAEIADILLYDYKTNIVHLTYSYSDGYFDDEPPWELGEGLTSKIILSRRPLLLKSAKEIDENGAESYLTAPTESDDVRSYLGVPIMIGDQILGVVDVQSFRAKAFDENNLRLLQTITSNIGVALENARLFDETQRLLDETEKRAHELSIINNVQADLSASMEMQSMYNMVGDKLREVFDAQVVTIIDYDPKINRNYWRYAVEKGEVLNIQPRAPFGFSKYIIETRQMTLVNDNLAERRRELGGGVAAGQPAKSYLGVPLLINNQVRGVISLQNVDRENAFSESDVRLLQTLANSMSVTLENARLFDETQHRERETSALLNISRDISASLEISTVLEGIATHAKNLLNGDVSALFLPEGDGSTFRATTAVGEDAENILNDTINVGEGILGNIAENKFGEIVNDVNNDPRAITIAGTDTSPNEHLLAVPLMANNELKGLMAVWRTGIDAEFLQTELEFLNGLARQAVIAVQNAQLFTEAQELRISAEQANIAKSAFMSNMSHELRTPLNAIIGFTRIVRRKSEGLLPEKQTENLDKVLTSADHLLGLINTVLDIAKIEAGRMDVQAANFPIHSLADQCANLATPLLKPAVTLEKQTGENIGLMYSDQEKIKQIVLNLLSNAAKFTHEGKIVLSVNRTDSNVNISVTDSGIGISEEALSRVFEEFQQADTSTTRQYGGTGLGLSISRNLAHLLGGELTVTSEFGKGSTFTLTLPIQYESKSDPSLNVKTDPVRKAEPHS